MRGRVQLALTVVLTLSAPLPFLDAAAPEDDSEIQKCLESSDSSLESADHWICRGNARHGAGDFDGAMRHYVRAAKTAPSSAHAQAGIALIYSEKGQWPRALERCDKAILLAPDYSGHWFRRAYVKRQMGREESAMADLDRALELDPRNARAFADRAALRRRAKRNAEALEDFRLAAGLDADYRRDYEGLRLELQGRPSWFGPLAAGLILLAGARILARRAERRMTGDEEADRQAVYGTKSSCAWLMMGGWIAGLFALSPALGAADFLGLAPLGPLGSLAWFFAGLFLMVWALEVIFSPLLARLQGHSESQRTLFMRAARDLMLCLAPMLIYQLVVLAVAAIFFFVLPETLRAELPGWLPVLFLVTVGLVFNAWFLPSFLGIAFRARKADSGPLFEAAQGPFRGLSRPPSLWLLREPAPGRMMVLTTINNRVLVSENTLELLSRAELEAVLSHESAHLRERHVAKSLLLGLAVAWVMCLSWNPLTEALLSRGLEIFLPILGFLASMGSIAFLMWNLRRNERIADRLAVEGGTDAQALISALEKLHKLNVMGRRWLLLDRLFASHPCMEERALLIRSIDRPSSAPALDLSLKVV